MDELNVLQLGRTLNYGGTETVILNLCKELHNKKKIKFIVCSSGGPLENELHKLNIRHYNIPDIGTKNIATILKTMFKIIKIIRNEKINIIHSHHRTLSIVANVIAKVANIKVIHTAHYMIEKTRLGKLLGSNIIAVGENVKYNLINEANIESEKIKVIYNGISIEKKLNKTISFKNDENKFKLVCISRLSKEKGIDILIKAMDKLIDEYKNVVLYIIGDGTEREYIENLIKENELDKYIRLLGFKNNPLEYVEYADLIVSSSRTEGLPITPLEAFSKQKTIVATNVGGISEIVINNYNGILVNNEDYCAIKDSILMLREDEKLRKKLEENAFNTVSSKFSINKMINEYSSYYIELVRNKK